MSKLQKLTSVRRNIICENKNSIYNYFAWPSVVRLPDTTLAMVASGFRLKHICPFGKGVICYSRDDGNTWTKPAVVIDTPLDDRDCGITVFGDNKVIMTSFNNKIAFQFDRNENNKENPDYLLIKKYLERIAQTDAEEKFLGSTYCISEDGGYTFGDIQRVPVTAPHGPCKMNDNTLLYIGRVFVTKGSDEENNLTHIQCYKQNKNGKFEFSSQIENITDEYGDMLSCEPHAIVLPDGKIIVHIRVQRQFSLNKKGEHPVFTIYQSESYDNASTFTKPHPILPSTGGAPPHLIRHSSGILISVYGYRNVPYGIRVMFSYDCGVTWDTDYILNDDAPNADLGYPATAELTDGSLLTVYYQYPKNKNHAVIMQNIWRLPENQ